MSNKAQSEYPIADAMNAVYDALYKRAVVDGDLSRVTSDGSLEDPELSFAHNGQMFLVRLIPIVEQNMPETSVKYPEIEVELLGNDGNAFAILGAVKKALRRGGVPSSEIEKFMDEATSGDYNDLLNTVQSWVVVI